ncbi:EamA-like transporter family [Seminavis robusta]|uniref:EamA-like transporter family n=1 Tax=Seminavis robusta TaxID=568900 RepID=A0A9N8H4H1_9STRA|nr:EamA-like transporter family [Seminavis robusta]|eukprot:Sro114_g056310.1 EamA-like transporter family (427) ;mRNA; r:34335-35615
MLRHIRKEVPPTSLTVEDGCEPPQHDAGPCLAMSLQNPSLNFARILVLTASSVYGSNFAIVKMLDHEMPVSVSAMLRFGLAATVVTVLTATCNAKGGRRGEPMAAVAGLEIGVWYCLGYLAQALGLESTDASKSAFFNALAVIVVPILDSLFRGKRLGLHGFSSVAFALLGVCMLELGPAMASGKVMRVTRGEAYCLAQAIAFGIGYWRLEHISTKYPAQAGLITVGQLVGVALGSTLFCVLMQQFPTLVQLQGWLSNGFTVASLVWTALISTALALYLETVALKTLSASEMTVLMTSVSLFGSAFAYLTMGETMSRIGMLGGLLILVGCISSSLGGGSSSKSDQINNSQIPNKKDASFWLTPIDVLEMMVDHPAIGWWYTIYSELKRDRHEMSKQSSPHPTTPARICCYSMAAYVVMHSARIAVR